MSTSKDTTEISAIRTTSIDLGSGSGSGEYNNRDSKHSPFAIADNTHGTAEIVGDDKPTTDAPDVTESGPKKTWKSKFAYFKTRDFWFVLALGQVLAVCITATNTFTSLLVEEGTSIPAFQTLFNYILLNAIYTSYTIYRYGWAKWGRLLLKDGWKYIILAFFDVEGNYFTVLAYRYTTILSAQLINFWAIVVVVILSFLLLKVRYHWAQILGIFICIGGLGMLLGSDHLNGESIGGIDNGNQIKGDLFALLGATFYGLSNVYEEWFVSGRPLYEVIGQLAFWAMPIMGVQAAIFDRHSIRTATWNGAVGGYLVGYTLILTIFYTLVPVLYRFASAAFQNISLLTGNFWGVIIGIQVFHLHVHWMYPIAFTLIMIGHFVYYLGKGVLGEAKKAWLGEDQAKGIDGLGSAKRKMRKMHGMQGVERGEVGTESMGVV